MLFSFYSMKLYIAIFEVIIEIHNHYDKINFHLDMLAYLILMAHISILAIVITETDIY